MYQLYHALQYHSQLIFVFICFVWRVKPLCCLWLLKPFPESLISIPSRWCWRNTVFRWSFQVRRSWEPSCRLLFSRCLEWQVWSTSDNHSICRFCLGLRYVALSENTSYAFKLFTWQSAILLGIWIYRTPVGCVDYCRCCPSDGSTMGVSSSSRNLSLCSAEERQP